MLEIVKRSVNFKPSRKLSIIRFMNRIQNCTWSSPANNCLLCKINRKLAFKSNHICNHQCQVVMVAEHQLKVQDRKIIHLHLSIQSDINLLSKPRKPPISFLLVELSGIPQGVVLKAKWHFSTKRRMLNSLLSLLDTSKKKIRVLMTS